MSPRVRRLRIIRDGIRGLRHDLAQTEGSDRISEVRMLDTITEAVEGLIQQAAKPRSRTGVPAVYQPRATR